VLKLEPGEFVLWDSRTIHCNHSSELDQKEVNHTEGELIRAIGFISMLPRDRNTTEEFRSERQAAVRNCLTTTHVSSEVKIMTPRPWYEEVWKSPEIPNPNLKKLTSLHKELICSGAFV